MGGHGVLGGSGGGGLGLTAAHGELFSAPCLRSRHAAPPHTRPPQHDWWRRRWVAVMDDALARLVFESADGSLAWTSDLNLTTGETSNYLEHLASGAGGAAQRKQILCMSRPRGFI